MGIRTDSPKQSALYSDRGFRRQVFEVIFLLNHGRNERGREVRPHQGEPSRDSEPGYH